MVFASPRDTWHYAMNREWSAICPRVFSTKLDCVSPNFNPGHADFGEFLFLL
jgi:hypothetical protein